MRKFEINQEAGTITYWLDSDTGQQETFEIVEVLDMLSWFKRREGVLRSMVAKVDPISPFKPMMPVNGFYVGVCPDRRKVKVRAEVWQATMEQTEKIVRHNWLFDLKKADLPLAAELEYFDTSGNPLSGPQDAKGNTLLNLHSDRAKLTEADCPPFLIQEEQRKISNPEWWVNRDTNLDRGQYVKLP